MQKLNNNRMDEELIWKLTSSETKDWAKKISWAYWIN